MHALPRVGDHIHCAFPASGIPKLFFIVKRVYFHQTADCEGRECREPFANVITVDDVPESVSPKEAEHSKRFWEVVQESIRKELGSKG
jgi:hypothetical protein